jgi:hypothetical protein
MMAALPDPTGGAGAIFGWISGHVLGGAASDLALAPINALASSIANAVGQLLVTLGTLWISLDVPNVWTGGTTSGTVAFLHSEVAPLVGLLAVLGIIIGAGSVLIGVTLMTMAILALPALLRFLVPAVAALHASSPTTAAAVAASSMPPGAKMLRHAHHVAAGAGAVAGVRGPSGAQGGPSGPTGPSGSASPPTPPATPPTPPVRPPSPVT